MKKHELDYLKTSLAESKKFEEVRVLAINLYNSIPNYVQGISEKCTITFIPDKELELNGNFTDFEKLFEVTIKDNYNYLRKTDAKNFKKAFAYACKYLYETKQI